MLKKPANTGYSENEGDQEIFNTALGVLIGYGG